MRFNSLVAAVSRAVVCCLCLAGPATAIPVLEPLHGSLEKVRISESCPANSQTRMARVVFSTTTNFVEIVQVGEKSFVTGEEAKMFLRALSLSGSFEEICVFQAEFAQVFKELSSSRADYAIGTITQTAERQGQGMNFGVPFFKNRQVLVVRTPPWYYDEISVFLLQVAIAGGIVLSAALFICFVARREVIERCDADDSISNPFLFALEVALHTVSTIGFGNRYLVGWRAAILIFVIFNFSTFAGALINSKLINYNLQAARFTEPSQMAGLKIAALSGTVHEDEVRRFGARMVPIKNEEEGVHLIQTGQADGMITDEIVADFHVQKHQNNPRPLSIALHWGIRDIGPASRTPELAQQLNHGILIYRARQGEGL